MSTWLLELGLPKCGLNCRSYRGGRGQHWSAKVVAVTLTVHAAPAA
jgi:hypothetical protein